MPPARLLLTEDLRLEAEGPGHAKGLWNAIQSSLPQLRPWMVWTASASMATTEEFVSIKQRDWDEARAWTYALVMGTDVVGTIEIGDVNHLLETATIGYWIRSDVARRGLMTQALKTVTRCAFDQIGLHRLELRAGVKNKASIRVAEKSGFRKEGVLRDGARGVEGFYDVFLYALLAQDAVA